jgi:hypothetical protein
MAAPAQFVYTYESKTQADKPANNATHITATTRNDPNFYWQNSGQERRGAKVWVRATKRRVTPEYKAYLASEKARREAEFDVLAGLLGSMTMASSGTGNKNNYALSLTTGEPSFVRQQRLAAAAQQAQQLKAEIDMLSAMLTETLGGGKKRRHTKRRHHSKRRHTRRN